MVALAVTTMLSNVAVTVAVTGPASNAPEILALSESKVLVNCPPTGIAPSVPDAAKVVEFRVLVN